MIGLPTGLLGFPAMLLAGATASLHCTAMCGALGAHHARAAGSRPMASALLWLHGGRVLGYALLGAGAGAIGQRLLRWLPDIQAGRLLQAAAALMLLGIGLQLLQRAPVQPPCCAPAETRPTEAAASAQALLLRGLLWALMPCALFYSVLLLAALSGRMFDGALIAGGFALGGAPLLAAAGWRSRMSNARAGAGWLLAFGLLSLAASLLMPSDASSAWCATPSPVSLR